MWKNSIAVKSISVITTIALAAGALGIAYVDTTEGVKSETAVITETAAAEPETEASMLQNIISTQVGSASTGADKEESVYVVADASGVTKEVIVSDWLKNTDGAATITDTSDLKDIVNVKGDETFTENGERLTWNANGNDIYYQGTTDKELPVDMKITYYLDGKEISAEDLAGKSGDVKIRFDYSNNTAYKTDIKGQETEVAVPFTMMTAMMLPSDRFSDVTVTNGRVMSEGNNDIVMGLAFPGLTESLDLDKDELKEKDIEIPEYFEVEAKVKDFALDMTLTVALSDALSDIHLTDSIDLKDVEDSVSALQDASNKLTDGSMQLAEGVKTLNDKTAEFSDGAGKLYDGIAQYTDGASALASGIDTLKSGSSELASGAGALRDGANTLSQGATELNNRVQAITLPEFSGLSDEQKAAIASAAGADSDGRMAAGSYAVADAVTAQLAGGIEAGKDSVAGSISGAITGAELTAGIAQYLYSQLGAAGLSEDQCNAMAQGILSTVAGNVSEPLASGIVSGIEGSVTGDDTKNAIASGVKDAMTQTAQASAIAGAEGVMGQVGSTIAGFSSSLNELKAGTAALADGAGTLAEKTGLLADGAGQLDSGVGALKDGAATLISNNGALKDGAGKLVDGTGLLSEGVSKLLVGADSLSNGMIEFDEEGIEKLTGAFEDRGEKVIDRLNATMEAARSYHTFSGLADGKEGNVKFIIRTESVK